MKQTAVEWLQQALMTKKDADNYNQWAFHKAKEMEKQQTIEFARHCLDKAKDLDIRTAFINVEEYYETF